MKKRILQISNYQYPHIGGIEQVARDIMNVLSERPDIEQKMICFNEDACDGKYVCHRKETVCEEVDGVEVIRCGCIAKVSSQSISITYRGVLKKLLKEFRPDIILFHYPNPFVASLLLPLIDQHSKLYLYWHLDITKQKILGKVFHRQNIQLIGRADKIIGATPKHVNESAYSPYFSDKKYVLPYAINESRLQCSDFEKEKAVQIRKKYQDKIICFFVGRHVEYKGLEYLIEASSKISNNNIKIIVAGEGELTTALKHKAQEDVKVEFVGRLKDHELRAYLLSCDIFCFPSITRNEAFGLALAEAMYFGKPAITFSIPGSGVNYVNLHGVTGIECENRNSEAFSRAILQLSEDEMLRNKYGKNAHKRVIENFTIGQFKKNIYELVEAE